MARTAANVAKTSKTYTLRDLWVKACKADGIDPQSKFVIFSTDNPWMTKYNALAGKLARRHQLCADEYAQPTVQR
jgi:hypothetical protein